MYIRSTVPYYPAVPARQGSETRPGYLPPLLRPPPQVSSSLELSRALSFQNLSDGRRRTSGLKRGEAMVVSACRPHISPACAAVRSSADLSLFLGRYEVPRAVLCLSVKPTHFLCVCLSLWLQIRGVSARVLFGFSSIPGALGVFRSIESLLCRLGCVQVAFIHVTLRFSSWAG